MRELLTDFVLIIGAAVWSVVALVLVALYIALIMLAVFSPFILVVWLIVAKAAA